MVPLGSLVTVNAGYGPDQVMHYNGFPAAEINGGAGAGLQLRAGAGGDGAAARASSCRAA